jgi:3-methyladenine DNA glycosylase/8-oxoguanine DNA glycosylase
MPDEDVIQNLIQVRGIGRWTAEMFLMFQLGRADVLPVDDLGVRKGFMLTYGLEAMPDKKLLVQHAVRWQPYRSVASWYMWRALE